ncbi:uncharacterized protein LOC141666100 [Apium graveolens]|uniref:uncharacterized protein LOC141666100 n=1 Tax=Apium graveolens TaxID=4045 RepID=UPI003D7A3DFF
MIKTAYLKKDWWYWSSPSVAAKICTIYGLALRIYAFDPAIIYEDNFPGTIHSPLALTEEEWDDTYTTNVKGALLMSKHVYILMRDSKQGGSVINISSIAGLNRGQLPGSLAYSSLKTALNALTKV